MAALKPRTLYRITLRAEPHVIAPVRALRAALKVLLRSIGLRCVDIEEDPQ